MAWTRAPAQLAFLLVLPVARALRASSGCLGLSAGPFPLNVDQLLAQSNHSKANYFEKLRAMGINSTIRMTVTGPAGIRLPNTCLAQLGKRRQHVIFMGDCMQRMSFLAYRRNEGSTEASIIEWYATSTAPLEQVRRHLQEQHLDPAKDTVVLWMGAALHGFFTGDKRWVQVQTRAAMLTNTLTNARLALPGVRIIWDSPSYIDLPLMHAHPPPGDYGTYEAGLDAKLLDELSAIDNVITAWLGVPLTQRHLVGSMYRGLQCDGIHADPHEATHSEEWGCYSFRAYEDLVLQGGLYSACKQRSAPYCLQKGRWSMQRSS